VVNRKLLDGYLGQRALSQSSVEGVTSALASFTRQVGLSLKGVDELDVERFEVSE